MLFQCKASRAGAGWDKKQPARLITTLDHTYKFSWRIAYISWQSVPIVSFPSFILLVKSLTYYTAPSFFLSALFFQSNTTVFVFTGHMEYKMMNHECSGHFLKPGTLQLSFLAAGTIYNFLAHLLCF